MSRGNHSLAVDERGEKALQQTLSAEKTADHTKSMGETRAIHTTQLELHDEEMEIGKEKQSEQGTTAGILSTKNPLSPDSKTSLN